MLNSSLMKKTILAVVALLCLAGTAAAQRHVEFRWHGIYFVGDGSYVSNLNRGVGDNGFADTVSAFMPSISGGFQFRKEAAVGAGFAYLADPTGSFTQLPLYVELRSHFMRSRITPYTVIQAGYSLPVGKANAENGTKIEEGGLYVALEGGCRYAISRSVAVAAHVGYRMLQSNKVNRFRFDDITGTLQPALTEEVTLHMFSFGLSLYFGND